MKYFKIYLLLSLTALCSCDISDNEVELSSSFAKIYDNDNFEASYIPIDLQQTEDGGFIILSGNRINDSDLLGINILRTDESGEFIQEQAVSEEFVNPVKSLIKINNQYYFIGMSNVNLQAHLFTIGADSLSISSMPISGIQYPLYVAQDDEAFMLLSYNGNQQATVMSRLGNDGNIYGLARSSIGTGVDVEAPLVQHFTRTGKQLPFFMGKTAGNIYFANGFFNHTLSLAVTQFQNEEDIEVILQGQQDDSGFSAATHIEGNTFAMARFDFGYNYIVPRQEINLQGLDQIVDAVEGNPFPELVDDAPIVLKKINVDGTQYLIYGSHTRSGQIVLLAFSATTGVLVGTKYLGSTNKYELASFIKTDDEGLAVAGSVYVAGRFQRICLFKLSPEELNELVN